MNLEELLKPVPAANRVKHVKVTNHFVQLEEQYVQIISEVSEENVSNYRSKINSLDRAFCKILTEESKDVEVIYRLGVLRIINQGVDGLVFFFSFLIALYKDMWEEMEPKADLEDSEYLKIVMISNLANKLPRWVNEFVFFDKDKEYNIVYFLNCMRTNDAEAEIETVAKSNPDIFKNTVNGLKKVYEMVKELEEITGHICDSSENEEVNELQIQFGGLCRSFETVFGISDRIYAEMLNYEAEGESVTEERKESGDIGGLDSKSTEIIAHHAKLLVRGNSNKLLGLCILYCVDKLNVDSMRLMANIKSDQMLSEFVQHIVNINTDDDDE